MGVLVRIPTQLRPAAEGTAQTEVDGATVQEVLDGLFERFGELRPRIYDEDGSLRRFVNVYLAGEDIRFLEGLSTPVADGAELTILPAVAGG
jgi:molybdopterin converting factor small subunit